MKLEELILTQLYILGAVGIGIAFLQVKHRALNKIQHVTLIPEDSLTTVLFILLFSFWG